MCVRGGADQAHGHGRVGHPGRHGLPPTDPPGALTLFRWLRVSRLWVQGCEASQVDALWKLNHPQAHDFKDFKERERRERKVRDSRLRALRARGRLGLRVENSRGGRSVAETGFCRAESCRPLSSEWHVYDSQGQILTWAHIRQVKARFWPWHMSDRQGRILASLSGKFI
jgi:hypothetical protein